jgi:uncharacterized membrane protein YfcA
MDLRTIVMLPFLTFFTGLLAGSLGIGGGLVLNPIFMVFGMLPEVATASCNVFVLMTSLSSFLQFAMAGLINFTDAFVLFILSLLGSVLGIFFIQKFVRMYKRDSILVFTLGFLLLTVGIIIPTNLVTHIIENVENNTFTTALKNVCK